MTLEQLITSAIAGGAIPTAGAIFKWLRAREQRRGAQATTQTVETQRKARAEELAAENTGRIITLVADREDDAKEWMHRLLADERAQHQDCRQVVELLGAKLVQRQMEHEDRLEEQRERAEAECQRRVARALEQFRGGGNGGSHGGGGSTTDPVPSVFGGRNMDTIEQ